MTPIVCMTGGGIKSAAVAARYAPDHELILLHLDYGQPSAESERNAAGCLAGTFPAARVLALDLPHVGQLHESLNESGSFDSAGSSLAAGHSIPALRGLFPVLVSVAAQCAARLGASAVATGISRLIDASHLGLPAAGAGQPDRLREFLHAFDIMVETLAPQRTGVRVESPLMDLTYAEVIQLAQRFHVPLDKLRTCRTAARRPCGRCESCTARAAAFLAAKLVDPLVHAQKAAATPART